MSSITNINFLNSILSRASQHGLITGIYTNYYDWYQITGGAKINNALLWYWNVYGFGPSDETPANFDGFRSFDGWTVPSVKQFAQDESVCGYRVNRNVYAESYVNVMAATTNSQKSEQLTVGGLGLGRAALFTGKPEIKG
ncbi:hypothetical protein GCK32_010928 [Trichostrongylus colubriformis]|uniref:Uncharacterized protein n=1 Tax=Trichostrongylus colubriformis TaxID=6319 RepID=A0AAN8FVZ7_TRICO